MSKSPFVLALAVAASACGHDARPEPGPAERRVEAAAPAQVGELHVTGELASGDFTTPAGALADRYELRVASGTTAEVVLQSAEFDTYLRVVTPEGQDLVNDDSPGHANQSRLSVAVLGDGTLKITVTSYAPGETGRYRLDVTSSPTALAGAAPPPPPPPAAPGADFIPNALRIAAELLASRPHHRVDLGPLGAPPAGAPPAPLAPPAGGAPALPATTPPGAPAAPGGLGTPIALGAQIEGRLEPGDETLATGELRDVYSFQGELGARVNIELQSGEFDPYLILVSPSGQQWENDDVDFGSGNTNSQILMGLPEAGTYRIVATSYRPGETGRYLLKVRSGSEPAPPPGSPAGPAGGSTRTITGALEPTDQRLASGESVDYHQLALAAGEAAQIRLSSSAFDPYLVVRSPGGQQWDNDDFRTGSLDSGLDLVAPEAGTYSVGVTSYRPGETGAYTLSVTTPAGASPAGPPPPAAAPPPRPGGAVPGAPAQPVAAGTVPSFPPPAAGAPAPAPQGASGPVHGTLAPGDATLRSGELADTIPMSFQAGETVSLRLSSSQFDPYLILRAPSGQQWDNDDLRAGDLTSGLDLTLTETGQYAVVVTSYRPGEAGAYTLTVSRGAGAPPPFPAPGLASPAPGAPPPPAAPGPGPQPGGGRVFGIYVGITAYPSGRLPLCAEDAIKLAEDMRRAGLQTEAEQVLLTDAAATAERIRQAFAEMARRVGPDDLFIFFYSGHGSQTAEQPGSTELDRREEAIDTYQGQITDDQMAELFSQIRARVAVIALDSCFSGGFARDVISAPNRIGYFSSEEDLTSSVAASFQAGGYLSHFLRLGLRGEADTGPRDGVLTAGELSHYLYTMFGRHMQEVRAETVDAAPSYQHLVIDRGSVRVSTPLVRY